MMKATKKHPKTAQSLVTTLAIAFFTLSVIVLLVNGGFSLYTTIRVYQESFTVQQQLVAQDASKAVSTFVQDKFNTLETAVNFTDPVTALPSEREIFIDGLLGSDPSFQQFILLNKQGRSLADTSGIAGDLSQQFISYREDAVAQTSSGSNYISSVYIDDATSEPLIVIAIPARNVFGDIEGSLMAEVNLSFMWDLVDQLEVGETGYAYVVDNQGNLIAFQDTARVLAGENASQVAEVKEFIENPASATDSTPEVASYTGLIGTTVLGTYVPLGTPEWAVMIEIPSAEAYRPIVQSTVASVAAILVMALLAGLAGVIIARRLAVPLVDLTGTATRIADGEVGLQASVSGAQEIATLATAFNTMTAQLRDLIGSLEQRVADRTKALTSVAEVSTAASTILETDKLLQQVVDLSKERFGFYHAHIYLLDETGTSLVLSSGAGIIGQQMVAKGHAIPLDRERSLVARAAREKKGVTVNDVTEAPDFLPNPLLPDTRSELAVPMIIGERVIGVFDVQSDVVGRFTEADIAVQTTLASQVASAVQNARQYEVTQKTATQLSEALEIAKLANWEYDVNRDRFIFNDHFYSIFHTTAEREGGYELSSAEYSERLVHPEDLPMVGSEIEKALKSTDRHYSSKLEHKILYRDGTGIGYMAVEVHIERDDQGRILRYYGANQDVTERKSLEVLNAQRARQQEAINLISQRIQATSTIEEALQITARELGHALGQKQTFVTLDMTPLIGEDKVALND
jgi:GAF domain-containing protein